MKAPRGCSERATTSSCVRFDDRCGFNCRLNKTGFRSPVRKKLFEYYVKCYEQVCRGKSVSVVVKKFDEFRSVCEMFPPLTPLPARFELLGEEEKKSTLMQLVLKQLDTAESIYVHSQGVVTQDYPDDMEVGDGNGSDPASEGVAITSLPPDDSSLQNVPLGSVCNGSWSPVDPPGFSLDPRSCTLSQLDHPEGRPPPSWTHECPDELNLSVSDMECRASRYPDMLPQWNCVKQQLISFESELKDRERNERLSLESGSQIRRRSLEEVPSQNQLRKASMEDGGFQGSYYRASDTGVKKFEPPMPDGEEDGVLRSRSISEALEVDPSLTGRDRKNVGDIRPEVYGGSAYGDLPCKTRMEGLSPQTSDLQVNGLCSGGENFVIMPNPGGNYTLLSVPIDRFVSAEPSADERDQWAERLLRQFDMPGEE